MNAALLERRFRLIYEIGCVACYVQGYFQPCQIHHLNLDQHAGQERRGDAFTIGLCPWHHVGEPIAGATQKQCRIMFGPSMKHEPRAFRERFGSDDHQLRYQNYLIRQRAVLRVGHEKDVSPAT